MKYSIRLEGDETTYGLVSQYFIPRWLATSYLDRNSTIFYPDGEVKVPTPECCQLCDRSFDEAIRPLRCLCSNIVVNHAIGYVAKICVDCVYYLRVRGGGSAPDSIRKLIDAGFKPNMLQYYLDK